MKASELMIGDGVYVPHNGSATHYGRVCGIYESEMVSTTLEKDSGFMKAISLSPIPLTPEILEKNGFKKQGFDGWEIDHKTDNGNDLDWLVLWRNDYSSPHLSINSFMYLYGSFSSFGINYVHELQHAFKLCGIKLEIKL